MKQGFQISSCTHKRKHVEIIPSAKDIIDGGWHPPPENVLEKIGEDGTWFISIDIETNDWEYSRGNKGNIGQFGFYNLCVPKDLEARIIHWDGHLDVQANRLPHKNS